MLEKWAVGVSSQFGRRGHGLVLVESILLPSCCTIQFDLRYLTK
jgi:hypothetical protein